MINLFLQLGSYALEKNGYNATTDIVEKRKVLLSLLSLMPIQRRNAIPHALAVHLDREKKEIRFALDKELLSRDLLQDGDIRDCKDLRDYLFAHSVGAPRDKKKFLAGTGSDLKNLLSKTIPDSLEYLEKKRSEKVSEEWFKENVSEDYDRFLEHILEVFYISDQSVGDEAAGNKKKSKSGKDWFINLDLLERNQADDIEEARKKEAEKKPQKKSNEQTTEFDEIAAYIKNKFEQGDQKELPPISILKINGKHIIEIPELRDAYINIVYYDLFVRHLAENGEEGKYCHGCRQNKNVTGKVPLSMKFYGTTNELYFENDDNKNAYKAFALCDECLAQVMVGMKYVENFLTDSLFGIQCCLIPSQTDQQGNFKKILKKSANLLKKQKTSAVSDITQMQGLVKKSFKKGKRFAFNLMFFFKNKQQFDILKYLSHIDVKRLMEKMALLDDFNREYELDLMHLRDNKDQGLSLTDIRYYLFPSDRSHHKPDFTIYGKDLLAFLADFLEERPISYGQLIRRFTDIFRRRFHRESDKTDMLSPFKMVIFLTILARLKLLKEDHFMNTTTQDGKAFATDVLKKEFNDFFNTHADVYEGNAYRQGLFLLGTVVSNIIAKQQKKAGTKGEGERKHLSSTFMGKLNLDGLPVRRIPGFIAKVKEYCKIYDPFEEPGIWGNIMDRLQGIDGSAMKTDETVFYILTGISFNDYLGKKNSMNKKLNQDNGEKHDQQ